MNETTDIREILDTLNGEQIRPVLETEGAVLVLAGAGSGKTRVLTSRIAYLVAEKGVPAEGILAITFTNKAANEMKERIGAIVDARRMWVCTIHSMCVRILRRYAGEAGLYENFSIYSETERNNIVKKSFQECDYEDEKLLKIVKSAIADAKTLGLSPEEYAEKNADDREIEAITKVYARYQKRLKENNALDFDDLLNETRKLLRRNAEVREQLAGGFRYILVDEFQDTNEVQFEIIRLLATGHGNLFAVGDDDQSIYGWRGAKIENILHFEKSYPNAKIFKLERNYRSTKSILRLANATIRNNGRRRAKTLWTENAEGEKPQAYEADEESGEARFVAHTIAGLTARGYKYSDFAVLMRINALTRSFEQEFSGDGLPYKVFGGFKFYERKEIKDLLAYLRLIANPFDDEAAIRVINVPKRGIGAKTVETLETYARETELSFYDALMDPDGAGFSGGVRQKLSAFAAQIKGWVIDSLELPVNELVKKIVGETGMKAAYDGEDDENVNKRANIDEFINSVEEFCRLNPEATLTDYLNMVTLSSDTDDMDESDYVTLATIHAVKGLEFKCVFIVGMEEGIMPTSRAEGDDDALEEERRLMYVAITRAKERLYVTRSKSRYLYGKREPTARSPFLKELSGELDLPKESRFGYRGYRDGDGTFSDEDPESYGNAAYAGGRYSSSGRNGYPNRGYGSTYGGGNGAERGYENGNSALRRSAWNGGSTYGGRSSYGSSFSYGSTYGSFSQGAAGFTYGGSGSANKPRPKATTGAGKDLTAFQIGVKVRHPKFGAGTIVNVRGTGGNMILDVAFEGLGIKQLSATLAPLTPLGRG